MANYRPASEPRSIAEELIPEHHPHLIPFLPEMRFVFRDKAQKSKGRVQLGSARKVTGLNAWLAEEEPVEVYDEDPIGFFVIEIAEDEWEHLSSRQRTALVDHELTHCWVDYGEDGSASLVVRGHDLEEFTSIVKRHGLWKEDLQWFGEAVQLTFGGTGS